jgi:hypothetical protein
MDLDAIQPMHCHALARRLAAEARAIREEMGRLEDARPLPEITGAEPRDVYFEALSAWRKAQRLAAEVGADAFRAVPAAPRLQSLKPGHVHRLLEGVLAQIDDIKARLGMTEKLSTEAPETGRQPSDVLVTLVRVNRELSRALERPFAPSDCYATVALASAYAERLGAAAQPTSFERRLKPAQCYAQLEACLARASALITKRGEKAMAARGTPPDVLPGDVFDLAHLVLGEVAFIHAITPNAAPLHAFEPAVGGHRLPAHVHQLARTLEAQLASLG